MTGTRVLAHVQSKSKELIKSNRGKRSQGISKLCIPRELGSDRKRDILQDMQGGCTSVTIINHSLQPNPPDLSQEREMERQEASAIP